MPLRVATYTGLVVSLLTLFGLPADLVGRLFLTPPSLQTLRLHAQLAIVVDWKSTPHVPEEVLQCRQRLADVAGLMQFRKPRQLSGGCAKMTTNRLEQLQEKYGIDYALLHRCCKGITAKYRAVHPSARIARSS